MSRYTRRRQVRRRQQPFATGSNHRRASSRTEAVMNSPADDRAEIEEVLIRYATGIDQKDWPLFRTSWTDDIVADYSQLGTFTSAEELTDVMTRMHGSMGPTFHRMSNFVIDVDGDHAVVRSYVHAVLMASPDNPSNWFDAVGHYDDVFVRTNDG